MEDMYGLEGTGYWLAGFAHRGLILRERGRSSTQHFAPHHASHAGIARGRRFFEQ